MKILPCVRCFDRLSLASRLMIVAALAMVLGGTPLILITVRGMADSYYMELEEDLDDGLDSVVSLLTEQAVVGDYAAIQQLLDGRVKRSIVALIAWTDAQDHSITARSRSFSIEAPDWFAAWIGFPNLQGERALRVGGKDYGKVFMRLTTAPMVNLIWHTFVRQVQVILFGGLLTLVLVLLLLKYGLRPLHRLANGAARFGQGDYSVRIAPGGAPELLPSIRAFNDMAGKIKALLDSQQEREAALKESEGRLRDITSNLGEGVLMLDAGWRMSFMNPEAERLLGWPVAELLGKDAHALLHRHPDGTKMPGNRCPIRDANLAGNTYRSRDESFARRDGSTFCVSLVSAPILKNGEVTGSVVAFYDNTARKQAEGTLRKFSRAVEQSANSVVITDAHGNIEYVNPSFCETTGYAASEAIGQNPRILKSGDTPPEEYVRLWGAISSGGVWRGEFHNRRKDGSLYWESASIAPIRNEKGEITHFVAVKEDITRRKEVEEELRRLNETLEQRVRDETAKSREKDHMLIRQSRLAAMGEMIGNIAHQWRQPLNALYLLLANIQDAQAYNELDPAYLGESVAKGQRLIDKMSSTIDDFRNFFKPDREKTQFSLEKAVRDALSVVEASLKSGHIAVDLKIERDDVTVSGFPNEYAQVVANILGNAKDAIQQRQVRDGKVEITIGADDVYAYVAIRDNGGGIPEDVLEKIFDPYFTTREKGTGIGLYMSKMIIETNMNGRIEVRNVGEGAEFRIATPLYGNGTGNG